MSRKLCKDLHKVVHLEVDGRVVDLPQVEGIIILNIMNWGSGANPWGPPEKEDPFSTPNHYDGMLEVVGVTGVVHLGQIQSKMRYALRIAQVRPSKVNSPSFNLRKLIQLHARALFQSRYLKRTEKCCQNYYCITYILYGHDTIFPCTEYS